MVNLKITEQELQELLRMVSAFQNSGSFSAATPEITSTSQAIAGGQRIFPVTNDLSGLSKDAADAVTQQWREDCVRQISEYCERKDSGRSTRAKIDSPMQREIDQQVEDHLQRAKARGWVKRSS